MKAATAYAKCACHMETSVATPPPPTLITDTATTTTRRLAQPTNSGTGNFTKQGSPPVMQGDAHATYKLHCEPIDKAHANAAESELKELS